MPTLSPDPDQPPTAPPLAGAVRFGIFEFDLATTELRRNGILVRLQAQPAKVLAYLLSHTDRIVSREELHDAIWGGSTFVDFERGLNVCIAQIRSALGDESSAPRYIRTIPRKGYEFICPIQNIASEPTFQPASRTSSSSHYAGKHLLGSVATALVILAIVAGYLYIHSRSHATLITIAVTRFDNETGDPTLDRFADALSDDVVAGLADTGSHNLRVIGNAAILRRPRPQRDLLQISNSLHAQFVVLGQIQQIGSQTRILAHLIRLPDQTHVWVVRLEQPFQDPAALEASASREITGQFSAKLANPASLTALHAGASR